MEEAKARRSTQLKQIVLHLRPLATDLLVEPAFEGSKVVAELLTMQVVPKLHTHTKPRWRRLAVSLDAISPASTRAANGSG